jgi:DNA mismatch repair protein MutS
MSAVIAALAALHPDEMSPRDALEALYALKAQLAQMK